MRRRGDSGGRGSRFIASARSRARRASPRLGTGRRPLARRVSQAAHGPVAGIGGVETLLVPRHYRGRLIGFVQREDVAGAMRVLGQLDRLAERLSDSAELRSVNEHVEALFGDEKLQKRQDGQASASALSLLG